MVFFPSYKYMADTYEHLLRLYTNHSSYVRDKDLNEQEEMQKNLTLMPSEREDGILVSQLAPYTLTLYKQNGEMSEEERESFLGHFADEANATLNFCVLGGIFSEGIDLTGEQLIGVAVVGVGIPQIGLERDLIKGYFDENDKAGYHYAYTYPGMNKVLQAIGRLIRTEEDKGIILLIDDRYQTALYQEMLPHMYQYVQENESTNMQIEYFWKTNG